MDSNIDLMFDEFPSLKKDTKKAAEHIKKEAPKAELYMRLFHNPPT